MLGSEGQRGRCEEYGAYASQENIGAIEVRGEAQFPTQMAKPQDHRLRPGVGDMVHKQSGEQDEHEDPPHALQGLHPHIFDIQAIFLVKAVGMLQEPGATR